MFVGGGGGENFRSVLFCLGFRGFGEGFKV